VPGHWLHDKEGQMFHALAYGFVGFTGLMVLGLLWMAWEHRRAEAKAGREKKPPARISN
jgi:hypothetical protein